MLTRFVIAVTAVLAPAVCEARSPSHWLEPPPGNAWLKLKYRVCPTRSENGSPAKPSACYDGNQLIGLTQDGYIYMRDKFLECPFNGTGEVRRAEFDTATYFTELECKTAGSTVTLTQTSTSKHVYPDHSEPTLRKSITTLELSIVANSCSLLQYSHVARMLTQEHYVTSEKGRYKKLAEESTYKSVLEATGTCLMFRSYKDANDAPD